VFNGTVPTDPFKQNAKLSKGSDSRDKGIRKRTFVIAYGFVENTQFWRETHTFSL